MTDNVPQSSPVQTVWTVLGNNPKAAYIYFGGVAASIVIHATLKGMSYFSRWKEEDKRRTRDIGDLNTNDRTEAVSSVLTGASWGFLQGCVRGWIWPVHAVAFAFVYSSKDFHNPHATTEKTTTENKE